MAAGRIVIILYLVVPFTVWTVADNICVDNCSWRPNGYYQSCYGCDVFTSCDRGHLNTMKCPENTVWDDALKSCLSSSQTCMEVDASAVDKGLVKYTGYGFTSPSIQVDQSPRRGALSHYASCPDGRVWTKCRGACQPTCKKPFRSFTCIRRCVTGCLCPNDSPILLNGKCIREAQCKALCPDGQVWSTCTAHCQPTCDKPRPICSLNCVRGCVCPEDRPFLHEGECIRQAQCPAPLECLETSRGFEYKGHKNKTATGRTCQAWHYQEPHKHSKCKPLYRNNYCTNMDNLERKCRGRRPWCYTMDPKKRWEYCAIPKCKVSCPEGRVWTKCKGRCRPTCKIPKPRCSRRCFSGCVCPTDSPFLHKGKCIKKAQCPVCNGQAGSRCVRSCVQDGNHQSCHGCNMYVTCNGLIMYDKRPCPANLVWDDNVKTCTYHSTTCKQC